MHRTRSRATTRRARNLAALALAAVLALSAVAVPMALAGGSKTVAGEATAKSLHKTVLTNTKGLTLYTLSGETKGKFICTTSECLKAWPPLLVKPGTTPKGPVKLGTVKNPEGKTQVTYKGMPIYTFEGDSKKGEANGEGLKDVGVWHAVTP
ncbi:MAG: COG4315 family predicted lipoprotein [Solirubrobacterales bacterium]